MTQSVPGSIVTSRGEACGSAPCAPAATIGGNDTASAPMRRIVNSRPSATVRSGRPAEAAGQDVGERVVGELRRGADAVELVGVLHDAQPFDGPARGHELDALTHEAAELVAVADAHLQVVEPETQLALVRELAGDGLRDVAPDLARPRAVELLRRLREVAEVGDEPPGPVRPEDGRAA